MEIGENLNPHGNVLAILYKGGLKYYLTATKKGVMSLHLAQMIEDKQAIADDMGTYHDNFQDGWGN